jgi:SAM-dependent methyltransferase
MGYYSSERRELLPHLQSSMGSVLELGCSEGRHGGLLLESGRAISVVGIDLRVPTDQATSFLTRFVRADVVGWLEQTDERFDTVLAFDILEHLVDPWSACQKIFDVLRPGGVIVASLPNVQFIKVSADLMLRGRFDYQNQGVLDRTHLRFFTRRSVNDLLLQGGFHDPEIRRLRYPAQSHVTRVGVAVLRDLGCKQFVAIAKRPTAESRLRRPLS